LGEKTRSSGEMEMIKRGVSIFLVSLIASLAWLAPMLILAPPALAQTGARQALVLTATGPLTPSMLEYIQRGIHTAEQDGAELMVIELNTPGGDINLMNSIVTAIRASSVPVVVYVAPAGAMAGSAGTLITLSGHASAMAPETIVGAASPVGAGGADLGATEAAKQKEALVATAQTLTENRPTQARQLAADMINNAKAVPASQALQVGLIDFTANNISDLMRQLNGFTVVMASGPRTLDTTGIVITPLPPTFIEQVLSALTDPNIVLLLLNVGVAAILIEISSPGGWIAGFVGVVCLALATYGLGILPVNWFGLIFLVLAFVLFILDIKAPTHGALTAAGVGSLIVAALVLFNSPNVPSFERVSVPVAVGSALMTGGLFFGILIFALRAHDAPLRTGAQILIGRFGTVTVDLDPRGQVQVGGELWTAEPAVAGDSLPRGTRVQVEQVHGVKLLVRKSE
jgi:membrane-bound serine protease (ClpP class)